MQPVRVDARLVACCGLYCGACRAFRRGRCPGCRENTRATWCKLRTCCVRQQYSSCAECVEHPDPRTCRRFNNLISQLFGLVFRSDRAACILQIRRLGLLGHAETMTALQRHSLRR